MRWGNYVRLHGRKGLADMLTFELRLARDKMQLACRDPPRASKAEERARAEVSGANALGWFSNTKCV